MIGRRGRIQWPRLALRGVATLGLLAGLGGVFLSLTGVFGDAPLSAPRLGLPGSALPARDLEAEQAVLPQVMLVSAFDERRRAAAKTKPAMRLVEVDLEVKSGDTLMDLLVGAGAERAEAYQAITALRDVFSPRDLRPGQTLRLALQPAIEAAKGAPADAAVPESGSADSAATRLVSLRLRPSAEEDVEVARGAEGFVARAIARPLRARDSLRRATIASSLYQAAMEAGVPQSVLIDTVRALSFDVDFQRDLQPDDRFEIFYEGLHDEAGALVKTVEPLFIELVLSGKPIRLYRFTSSSGVTDYFNEAGQSVRKTLMRTPIDGARLSSGFGMRKHPILGYSKLHTGDDFAAPRGTPIYAAGDGVVEMAGRNGASGNYVRIRHNSTYKTAYAHMQKVAGGIRRGTRVRQGQVVGYVGSTGRSTGPHLHYEVQVNGKPVNPRSIKLPAGENLKGAELETFRAAVAEIDRRRETALSRTQIARARGKTEAEPCADNC